MTKLRLNIRSEFELCKRLSCKQFPSQSATEALGAVLLNHDDFWVDHKDSEPEKGKYLRSVKKNSPLFSVLKLINNSIFKRHDILLSRHHLWGGISGKDNIQAACLCLGIRGKRSMLKIDLSKFFEQVSEDKLYAFFVKNRCTKSIARILARILSVPRGAKGSGSKERVLARGFSTSPRAAIWCYLGFFQKLSKVVEEHCGEKPFRIFIYVDDITIVTNDMGRDFLEQLFVKIHDLARDDGVGIHTSEKKEILTSDEPQEVLGVSIFRNSLGIGKKTIGNKQRLTNKLRKDPNCKKTKESLRGIYIYNQRIKQITREWKRGNFRKKLQKDALSKNVVRV